MIIVAEYGSNLFPYSRERTVAFLDATNADAVKVQLFLAAHFPSNEQKAKSKVEFPRNEFPWFVAQAQGRGFSVGASVFDTYAVDLCAEIGVEFIKLATREQDNHRLRDYVHEKYSGLIVRSVEWPLRGRVEAYEREITLACDPHYPSHVLPGEYPEGLPEPFGWSSHTCHYEDCLVTARRGAKLIEKHFALSDKDAEYKWSLLPDDFSKMVDELRSE